MTSEFISLAVIAAAAAFCPLLARLIPRQIIPETVLLIAAGAILGPNMMGLIQSQEPAISMLKELGCSFLFLLAGFEINPKSVTGKDGKHGLLTWFVTFAAAIGLSALMPALAKGWQGLLATALMFTTTALGALMPMLKEDGLIGTRVGELVISYGTWGELATIFAVAILLSARSTWKTAAILGAFVLLCVLLAAAGSRAVKGGHKIYRFLESKSETTSQAMVRVTVLLLIILVALSAVFDLDIVLGAFAAGFVLRYIIPNGDHSLETKLDGIAYGFFIPLFFIASGCTINLRAVAKRPMLMVYFILALILLRTIPIVLSLTIRRDTRAELSLHNRFSAAFYCTAALPLIVAIAGIETRNGMMSDEVASVLIAAGAVTIFLMPFLGKMVYKVTDSSPIEAIVEISHSPSDFRKILIRHRALERRRAKKYRREAHTKIRSAAGRAADKSLMPDRRKDGEESENSSGEGGSGPD